MMKSPRLQLMDKCYQAFLCLHCEDSEPFSYLAQPLFMVAVYSFELTNKSSVNPLPATVTRTSFTRRFSAVTLYSFEHDALKLYREVDEQKVIYLKLDYLSVMSQGSRHSSLRETTNLYELCRRALGHLSLRETSGWSGCLGTKNIS